MANPLAIALALYGGYKGYKAGKERGGTAGGILGGILGAAGGYYGGQYIGGKMGLPNSQMTLPFQQQTAVQTATNLPGSTPISSISSVGGVPMGKVGASTVPGTSPGILSSAKEFAMKNPGFTLGTLAGTGLYASGAFKPEPYKRAQFTYNVAYPELYRNRQFFVQDPQTGQVQEQAQLDYIPEENVKYVGQDRFGPYGMATKTMNTGGLVEIAKFNEGGMPVKSTHDENDINNYKRANGYVADHTNGANKDEDTILAQLADGEFVTRTDGILGAGIVMGADPSNEKEMRKKGAEFFYDQQKKMKRLYDLFNKRAKTVN